MTATPTPVTLVPGNSTPATKSARGAERRQRILSSAADLMAEHGYSSVSMAQIGAAAGIVGSGVYRHFDSKATILGAFLDGVVEAMRMGTREVVATTSGPGLLEAMVRRQTQIVIANHSLVTVYLRDAGNLPPKQLRETRRQQRRFVEEWIEQCALVAPTLGELELRTVVQAVLALINSICTYDNPLPGNELLESVSAMASVALRVGIGAEK